MNPQVEVFRDLLSAHSTWDSLQAYLTSPDGGQIRCVGEGRYRILRYVKGSSDLKTPYGKWMRSVVWDTEAHLPVCVAPPKAEMGDVRTGETVSYPLVQTFLDGMMINAFRTVDRPNELQLATRTQLGAGGKFYSEKTFEQMFDEALQSMGKTRQDILNLLAQPTAVVPNHFASFVLQHPDHRVVSRCSRARAWIVHLGAVHDSGLVSLNEDPEHWSFEWRIPKLIDAQVSNVFHSEATLSTFFSDLCKHQGWFFQGITVKDGKGNRWRLRNPNYLYLRTLRGSESTPLERFLRLRSESKVTEYLKHYTEERQVFWESEQSLRKATQDIFQAYCDVHKSHQKKLEDVPWAVRPCVFKLHAHYLEHLRPQNEKVYMKHAVELVNNLALYEQKRLLTPPPNGLLASASRLAESAVSPA
jgi:hypothetical protein